MPLFGFIGDDELAKSDALEKAIEKWLGPESDSYARELYFGEELDPYVIAQSYDTMSLFAPKKAILIRGIDKTSASSQEVLLSCFKQSNDGVAVFAEATKWDARQALRKYFSKHGTWLESKAPKAWDIPQWLNTRARVKYSRILSISDASYLKDLIGIDLNDLDMELSKLDTFLPEKSPILAKDIEEMVSPRNADIFVFQNSMGMRDKAKMLHSLRSLVDSGDPAFLLCMRLYSHCLTLLRICSCLQKGKSDKEIADELQLNYYFHFRTQRYAEQAKSRPLALWKKIVSRLSRMELDFKQGRLSERFEIELAFAAMM